MKKNSQLIQWMVPKIMIKPKSMSTLPIHNEFDPAEIENQMESMHKDSYMIKLNIKKHNNDPNTFKVMG